MTAAPTAQPRTERRHIAIIPCRWGASRFPGKPLAPLGDKPLLWHVHKRCMEATRLDGVLVATDDERIEAVCRALGIECMRTREHLTGTDRVAECAERVSADAYINVQGDEPFIAPTAIDAVSDALHHLTVGTLAVNAYTELDDAGAVLDHNVVKVVLGTGGNALMFSRQPIPYPRGARPTYLRQLGLYGFTGEALRQFRQLPQGPLERTEGVEMLRFIGTAFGCFPSPTKAWQLTRPKTSQGLSNSCVTESMSTTMPQGAFRRRPRRDDRDFSGDRRSRLWAQQEESVDVKTSPEPTID